LTLVAPVPPIGCAAWRRCPMRLTPPRGKPGSSSNSPGSAHSACRGGKRADSPSFDDPDIETMGMPRPGCWSRRTFPRKRAPGRSARGSATGRGQHREARQHHRDRETRPGGRFHQRSAFLRHGPVASSPRPRAELWPSRVIAPPWARRRGFSVRPRCSSRCVAGRGIRVRTAPRCAPRRRVGAECRNAARRRVDPIR